MTEKTSSKRGKVIIGGTSSTAAEEVIVSNEDLLTQILLRLPAKSLMRFKCVSKNWLLLISDSHFAFNHARRNRNRSISALYFYSPLLSTAEQVNSVSLHGHSSLPTLAFLNGGGGESATIRIKSSCNGLLLCGIDRAVCNRYTTSFIVCNPTTQKFKVLPEHGGNSFGAYLAFDPSKSPHYKIVSLRYYRKIDIYSSESVSWKQIDVDVQLDHRRREGVFWNGAIHWLIDEVDIHFRFEVDAEKLMQTPHPPRPKILSLDKIRYFGECGGHLILIQMRSRYAMGFRILEMDGDYCRWTVKFWVNLRPLISLFPEIDQRTRDCKFHVLCVVKGENENDFALVLAIAGKAISYNLKFKTLKVLHDHLLQDYFEKLNGRPYPFALTYQFVESLSLV